MQEILRLYEMSENNEWKRISWAIHKRNKNKMMRYRQLCSNDEEFLSFKDGFLEQVPPSQQQINQRDLPETSSCNTNVNFQVDGQADHDALNRNDGCEGYATDSSEEFRTAEEIEHYHSSAGSVQSNNSVDDNDGDNDTDSESDSDSDEEVDDNIVQSFFHAQPIELNFPFTSNSNFHQRDHLLAVVAMSIRYNFSYEATLNVLKWIKLTHNDNSLPTTKKALWKTLNKNNSVIFKKKQNFDSVEDVYDGSEYVELSKPGNFLSSPNNYSFTFNTDGCQPTSSSSVSGWPIYLQLNELSPHMRKKYIFLAGVFVDTKHPLMNNFLHPFTDQMKEFYEEGVSWKPSENRQVTSKFIVTTCSVDSPARALVTRMNQFNGYFGCTYCYAKGERNGSKNTYTLNHCFQRLRLRDEMLEDMKTAFLSKVTTNGVKGIPSLISLPEFDISKGVVVEAMHAVFLGAVKQHADLLMTSVAAEFYIGKPDILERINQRLLSIKPPTQRSRAPRSLATYKQWKASEWRNWLDYVPICSNIELDIAEELIKKYVTLFEEYLGEENMSYNIHLLTHLTNTVRLWGPFWAHDAFSFEAWNKKIVDKITSAYARADQVVTRYLMSTFLELTIYNPAVAEETRKFICDTLKLVDHHTIVDKFINIGRLQQRQQVANECECLRELDIQPPEELLSFFQVKVNKIKYKCDDNEDTKFCNSYIFSKMYGFGKIISIVEFTSLNENTVRGFFIKCLQKKKEMFDTNYIVKIEETKTIKFLSADEDIKPAIIVSTVNGMYAFKLANCWETD
ncbi:Protein of unknown function [Cotesia congregata]|uniref:Transposase domain-containing protein n=1 Tax=Cotesia congregata TaxID=51543 RepID=A0A8J2MR55_COTCN|nr:Protein of unknown function [Cotesia congregata]